MIAVTFQKFAFVETVEILLVAVSVAIIAKLATFLRVVIAEMYFFASMTIAAKDPKV